MSKDFSTDFWIWDFQLSSLKLLEGAKKLALKNEESLLFSQLVSLLLFWEKEICKFLGLKKLISENLLGDVVSEKGIYLIYFFSCL